MSGSKQTQSSTQTVTPNNPQWVTDGAQALTGKIGDLLNQNPQSFVAGPQSVNQNVFGLANDAASTLPGLFKNFSNSLGGVGQAFGYNPQMAANTNVAPGTTAYGGIGNYLNPYTQDVTQATLRDMGQSLGIAQNAVGQNAEIAGGYGGSRQGVAQGLTNDQFFKNVGSTLGNLNYQGFQTALGAANSDAERAQQANLAKASMDQQTALANQGANNSAWQYNAGANDTAQARNLQAGQLQSNLGNSLLSFLTNAGGTQQGIAQQQAQSPLSVLQALTGAYGALPLDLFGGKTVTGTGTGSNSGSLLDTIGKVAGTAASVAALSDVRTKRDVETVGYDAKGRRWVDFNYVWDAPEEPKRRGVIAQEVQKTDPEAVGVHPSGFLMVDYGKLES